MWSARGSWIVEGGMRRLAAALADLAQASGAKLRYGCEVARILVERGRAAGVVTAEGERIAADAVVFNGDVGALATGLLGEKMRRAGGRAPEPSLSAVTWGVKARAEGAPWSHHNVLFGDDYREEFEAVFARGQLPADPTIYVCAQDRGEAHGGLAVPSPLVGEGKGGGAAFAHPESAPLAATPHPGPPPQGGREVPDERLFLLVNAPAHRAEAPLYSQEIERCEQTTGEALSRLGVSLDWRRAQRTTPADFSSMFPGSRGALYGPPSHGWRASFARAAARTALPGLYLAGGSVHPGPGVPMAALSGRQAALAVAADFSSTVKFRPAATPGGTWTRSATTDATG